MSVLRLVGKSNKETIETLEWMLQEAKRGKLDDMITLFPHEGEAQAAFTGRYKADSSKALMAIMRVSAMLTKAHDSALGSP